MKKLDIKKITNNRLWKLMNDNGITDSKFFARLLIDKELYTFDNFGDKSADSTSGEYKQYFKNIDTLSKRITHCLYFNQFQNDNLLIACCHFFKCSADYLLGLIDLPTHADTDIYNKTGLNEESIQTLRELQLSDKNENSITIFPKNLYEKIVGKEKMTPEEMEEFEKIFLNPSEENIKPYPSNRPKLMDLLNFILSNSLDMESLLMAFRNLINPFTVPVFYDDKNGWTFPDNQWSKDVGFNGHVTYTINLASDEKNPADNLPIWVDKNFIESVNMKSIERIFSTFYDKYKKQNKSSNQK